MMSPAQYRWYIKALGMSQAGAGRYLGVSERTSRRFSRGEAEVPTSMVLLLRCSIPPRRKAGGAEMAQGRKLTLSLGTT